LIRKRGYLKSVKIGEGWMEFVERNGFSVGETLNFKFVDKKQNNLMNVFEVGLFN
jgi:hypothetical protein